MQIRKYLYPSSGIAFLLDLNHMACHQDHKNILPVYMFAAVNIVSAITRIGFPMIAILIFADYKAV